jgi:type II secretory pathway component PulF
MKLAYQAYDAAGQAVADTIDATSTSEASEQLRRQGLFVTRISEAIAAAADEQQRVSHRRMSGSRRLKNLAMFTRQLFVLLSTGTPVTEALGALKRQAKDARWQQIVGELQSAVEQGGSLSDAMADHPQAFDTIYRSLITAGETSGKFEPILERLSQLVRKRLQTRSAVSGALVYPALLLVVAGVVLSLMLVFVLPRFAELFKTLDMPLPPSTQVMMVISDTLRGYWWLILAGGVAIGFATRWWVRTPQGRDAFDSIVLRVPLLGPLVRSFIIARILRLLGVLTDSSVPLLDAIDLTKTTAGNVHYRRLMTNAEDTVTRGEPISSAFSDPTLVSPSVYEAIRSGESTGKLSVIMINMADFLDEENETLLKTVTGLLEPLILIVLGVLVGLVALSMFLPLFDLTAQAGGG